MIHKSGDLPVAALNLLSVGRLLEVTGIFF